VALVKRINAASNLIDGIGSQLHLSVSKNKLITKNFAFNLILNFKKIRLEVLVVYQEPSKH